MGPGQRIIRSRKGRELPQVDGKMLYPRVEQREITKDHPSCSRMRSPRDIHKPGLGGTDQVLQNVHRKFQVIRQGPHLTIIFYTSSKGGVQPPSPRGRGHIHGGQWLGWRRYHDASINLHRGIQLQGVPGRTSFRGAHPGARTSKQKTY